MPADHDAEIAGGARDALPKKNMPAFGEVLGIGSRGGCYFVAATNRAAQWRSYTILTDESVPPLRAAVQRRRIVRGCENPDQR